MTSRCVEDSLKQIPATKSRKLKQVSENFRSTSAGRNSHGQIHARINQVT
jgi:hypothetical protein